MDVVFLETLAMTPLGPITVESRADEMIAERLASSSGSKGEEAGWHARTTPPVGSIGYTGSYREPSANIVEVSVVSVLEARGPY
jgi:hypothetical protein